VSDRGDADGVAIRGLVVDYGGVLTVPIRTAFDAWLDADRISRKEFGALFREWTATEDNPVHRIETGTITGEEFAAELVARLRDVDGAEIPPAGLIDRIFAGLVLDRDALVMLRAARAAGLRTALLSNSWAMSYPWADLGPLLDARVVSGDVGLRKPDPAIYHLAAEKLGLRLDECAFVDDIETNVDAARALGMYAVHHTDLARTLAALVEAIPALAPYLADAGDSSHDGPAPYPHAPGTTTLDEAGATRDYQP
jgi:putative hydrolase of the HAD superfamily